MSKRTKYLVAILLIILTGTFLYWNYCCGHELSEKELEEVVQVVDVHINVNS